MAGIPKKGFREYRELHDWLKSQPEDRGLSFSRAIALRSALRALPFVGRAFDVRFEERGTAQSLTLAVLRANAISRVALRIPTREIEQAADNAAASAARAIRGARVLAADNADNAAAAAAYTTYAIEAAAATVTTDAPRAAAAAAYAARAAAFAGRRSAAGGAVRAATAATAVWEAVTNEAQALDFGVGSAVLAASTLWPKGGPEWWTRELRSFVGRLSALGDGSPGARQGSGGWTIWLDWYRPIAEGKPPFGLPRGIADEIEKRIALGDGRKDFWERSPEAINREIAGWVEEVRKAPDGVEPPAGETVPVSRPSSVRPHWQGEMLVNVHASEGKLGPGALAALFGAIKAELLDLARKTRSQAVVNSIAKDARDEISGTARLIPAEGVPDLQCLFRLAAKEGWLIDYTPTVNREWPEVVAGKYRAVSHQLGKALDQFDELTQFKRNANEAEIGAFLADDVRQLMAAMTKELKSRPARRHVAADIPQTLDRLAEEAARAPAEPGKQDAGETDRTSYDLLEGANNLMKEIVIKAEEGGPVAKGNEAYEEAFARRYEEASRKAGEADAESAAKWANRAITGKRALGMTGHELAKRFPRMFGWFGKRVPAIEGDTIDLEATEVEGEG